MAAAVKALMPALAIIAGMMSLEVYKGLMDTVRVSAQVIELNGIDKAMQRELAAETSPTKDPLPKTEEAFAEYMAKAFEDQGSDNALDQWGTGVSWKHPKRDEYLLISAGPDKEFSTEDDLILHRDGKKVRMSKSPEEVAAMMESEAGKLMKQRGEALDAIKKGLESEGLSTDVNSLINQLEKMQEEAESNFETGEGAQAEEGTAGKEGGNSGSQEILEGGSAEDEIERQDALGDL